MNTVNGLATDVPSGTTYYSGSNIPGYMPDEMPLDFDQAGEAMLDCCIEMRRHVEQLAEQDDITESQLAEALAAINTAKADASGEFGVTLYGRHFFVSKG